MSTVRQKVQSIGITLIVVLISLIFVLQFGGPQSQGCSGGSSTYAAQVYGETISVGELKAALRLANEARYSTAVAKQMQFKEKVLQGLIERNLLAREAKRLGFAVSEEEVMERLAKDALIYVSGPVGGNNVANTGSVEVPVRDEDGNFEAQSARRFIQNRLGRSVQEFSVSQIQETLAQRMRETYAASVQISPTAAWEAYEQEKDRASLKYVRFSSKFYSASLQPTAQDIKQWVADNKDAVAAEYDKQKHRYTGLEKQVRARHILIKSDGSDEAKHAEAKAKAEALLAKAKDGADFAKLATENSEDTGSAVKGGDLGFNKRGRMVAPFDEAQFALKAGELSEVVATQFGFHVIKVEAVREGDVPLEEAQQEIGENLYADARAAELAKAAADAALASLKSGKTLDQLEAELKAERGEGETAEGEKPKPSNPLAPSVAETRTFGRSDTPVPGVDGAPLVEAAFALSMEKPLGQEVIKAGDDFFVVSLASREVPERSEFEGDEQRRLTEALLRSKRDGALQRFITELREKAQADGQVRINPSAVAYPGGAAPVG